MPFVTDYSTPEAREKSIEMFMKNMEIVAAVAEPFSRQIQEWEKNLSAEDRKFWSLTDEELWEMVGDVLDEYCM